LIDQAPLPVESYKAPVSTGDSQAFKLVSQWLESCIKNHPRCARPASLGKTRFARIIELCNGTGEMQPRLREVQNVPINMPYVTLSHCWGGIKVTRLLLDNYETFTQQIPAEELPKTFCDAMLCATQLGASYLWIDSFCIIQDSQLDWSQQAAIMGEIYQGALCNIAATAAENGHWGLFFTRDPETVKPLRAYASDSSQAPILERLFSTI
jgi:Heterokaryon incompatibility protein (HET)